MATNTRELETYLEKASLVFHRVIFVVVMIKHAYIAPYTLDNHIILYVSQDKKILLTNEYLAVKGFA